MGITGFVGFRFRYFSKGEKTGMTKKSKDDKTGMTGFGF